MLRKMAQVTRRYEESASPESWIDYIVQAAHFIESECEKAGMTAWLHEQRRRKWRWAGHAARFEDRRWTKLALDWIPDGRRRQGRPTKRWEDDLIDFVSTRHVGMRWDTLAKDRTAWKGLEREYACE